MCRIKKRKASLAKLPPLITDSKRLLHKNQSLHTDDNEEHMMDEEHAINQTVLNLETTPLIVINEDPIGVEDSYNGNNVSHNLSINEIKKGGSLLPPTV